MPPSHEGQLDSQEVQIRLPAGQSPDDYAGIAYADIPDGGAEYNGVGGRNVLLFHSAMACGRDPFNPNGEVARPLPMWHGRPIEQDAFVFLNAAAAGVKHHSVNPVPNNLVDHVLNRRISVERVIGGPDHHHVQYRPDTEERY